MRTIGAGTGARADVLDPSTAAGLSELGLGPEPLPRLTAMVADRTGCRRARLLTVRLRSHPYDRPALTTASRHLVSGSAVDDAGRTRDYALFVKVVRSWRRSPLSAAVPEPLRSTLASLLPWRTEPDVYRGDLGRRLPPGLRLPRVHHVADLDDESAAVWLEHVPVRRERWDLVRHRRAARLLGRLAASPSVAPIAAAVPVGRTPRGYAEHWLDAVVVPELTDGDLWRHPLVAETVDERLRRGVLGAAAALPALVEELESRPRLTAHGDACTDNLLLDARSEDVVLVDFGFWGTAPVGFDLGQLLVGEVQLGLRPAGQLAGLERVCLPAYVRGLRDEGCTIPLAEVARAHAVAMTVFHAVPAIPDALRSVGEGPELRARLRGLAATTRFVLGLLRATGGVPGMR
ncbi:phosphotransferase [Pseudonocardia tropica]|uniref:Phosphotransferase n=1 Tax=Pseudonocardia tropica TaxID=681289 RepID=A0ABV1K360_9PSEU